MRVIGGTWGGRRLLGPPRGAETRPTSDRVREAIFNIVAARLDGARVLDLFAGTGALGIEALSRGAAFALFVDDGAAARGLARGNLEALGLGGASRLYRRDATRLGPCAPLAPFDLAFLDPPYGRALAGPALAALRDGGWLTPGALAVVEEEAGAAVAIPDGYEVLERRAAGDTQLLFLRRDA